MRQYNGLAKAADDTANWKNGFYYQILLDRKTLDVWTVTHVSENNWCQITDPYVCVAYAGRRKISEKHLTEICESVMDNYDSIHTIWDTVGCGGKFSGRCYMCNHLNDCANQAQ